MKKRLIRLMLQFCIITTAVIGSPLYISSSRAQAAPSSTELTRTYINSSSIILHLGESGKDTYDFNIKSAAKRNIAKYSWYIMKGKGNPEAITINSSTGQVKAHSIGTAYVRCKITLTDKTIIRPEAKVIVRNNISSIEFTDLPTDNTIASGSPMHIVTNILNTSSGKDKATNGIIRFELKDDTAGVGTVSEAGILTPSSPGLFSIRAVCFESTDEYLLWLENKERNGAYITASTDWVTIKVISPEATASTQRELDKLLSSNLITSITVAAKDQYLKIPKNDFSDKILIVQSPNTTIENHSNFKQINIKSSSGVKWKECATKNSFILYDCDIDFTIDKEAQVESIMLDTEYENNARLNNKVVMNIMGSLETLNVMTRSDIAVSGFDAYVVINVEGPQTILSSSIPLILNLYTNIVSTFSIGSERSYVTIFGDVSGVLENLTSDILHINNNGEDIGLDSYHQFNLNSSKTNSIISIDTSNITKLMPRATSYVYTSAITSGKTLSSLALNGTFYYNTILVPGTLSWCEPETVINDSGFYNWIFTPKDTIHYNTVTGRSYVQIRP